MNVLIKGFWPELYRFRWRLLVVILLGLGLSAFKALLPELLKTLADVAWDRNNPRPDLAVQIPIFIALLWLVASVMRYFHLFWMKFTADQIAVKFRSDLMDKYLSLSPGFFQNFERGSGGLISRMLNDIQIIQVGIHRIADIVREPFMMVFAFGYLVYIDWKLTGFILITLPIVTGVSRRIARSLRKYGHRNQEAMEELTKTLKESLDGTRVVQSFNLQEEMRAKFNQQAQRFLATRKKIISREEVVGPISESLVAIAQSALLIYIGHQVLGGNFTQGKFFAFLAAVALLQDAVKKFQDGYIKLQQATVALERFITIMGSVSPVKDTDQPKPFPVDWKTIEYRNVSFSFGNEAVLKNINLTVNRGEMIAIVGASGGGKSTLVNLLERFFDPTEGEVLIDGVNIRDMSLKDLRDHIALVTQDVFLFGDSIERNIQLGDLEKDVELVESAAKLANAHDFILRTEKGYESRVGDHGSRLSGGEKQRISIARAIYKNAPILILDEATSALDSESEKEVQKGLDSLLEGRTAFVIAHRLSTITRADRILVLKDGQIVEDGKHHELLEKKAEYFRYHKLQSTM